MNPNLKALVDAVKSSCDSADLAARRAVEHNMSARVYLEEARKLLDGEATLGSTVRSECQAKLAAARAEIAAQVAALHAGPHGSWGTKLNRIDIAIQAAAALLESGR